MVRILILLFISIVVSNTVKSQCFDTTLANVGAPCFYDYEPVCACNGITYRNFCYATREGFMQFQNGICEAIDVNIDRNPVFNIVEIDLVLRNENNASLYIFDFYGKTYHKQQFSSVNKETILIDVNFYPKGIYIVLAYSNEDFIVKRFVKMDPY